VISGNDDDLIWQDEMLQDQLRTSIAALPIAQHDIHDTSAPRSIGPEK